MGRNGAPHGKHRWSASGSNTAGIVVVLSALRDWEESGCNKFGWG